MAEDQASPNQEPEVIKKRSNKKLIIIIVAILLIVCFLAAVVFGTIAYFSYKAVSAPVDPIKKQLEAINNGDVKRAYEKYTSSEFKKQTSLNQFEQVVEDNPQIFKSKSSSFTNINIKNDEAIVEGTITGKDGTVAKMAYKVVKEEGKWLIFGFEEVK